MNESFSHIPYRVNKRHIARISVRHIFDLLITWMSHGTLLTCVSRAADIQRYAKHAWNPFCAAPAGQSVRTAGSQWRAAAWCRVTQLPVKTPSCALFAHEHLLSGGGHICSSRGESTGNVATTAQRSTADAQDIGCCSVLQCVAICCSEFRAVERKRQI